MTWLKKYSERRQELRRTPQGRAKRRARDQSPKYRAAKRAGRLKRIYGITQEDFEQLLIDQENRCALCGNRFELDEVPHVDHDHQTGRVRGLLHHMCNVGLGSFRDDPDLLRMAAEYLEKTQE